MKTLKKNEHGVSLVWLKKGEDFPGTTGITTKQGYYIHSPNQGDSWTYLGAVKPSDECLSQWFEA